MSQLNPPKSRDELLLKMLRFLIANDGVWYRASVIGEELWPNQMGRANAAHARSAGKLLKWAASLKLVRDKWDDYGRYWTFSSPAKAYIKEFDSRTDLANPSAAVT